MPGNHDAELDVGRSDKNLERLLRLLRQERGDSIDDALADAGDRALLAKRFAEYLGFVEAFTGRAPGDGSAWSERIPVHDGLALRLVGLNSAWIAQGGAKDEGALQLGQKPLADHLGTRAEGELALVLTHHPLRGGWLRDGRRAEEWVRGAADVLLSGHEHDPDSVLELPGSGQRLVRIAAGAVHEGAARGEASARHGYNLAALVAREDGEVFLRVHPRRWSEKKKRFLLDIENAPEGQEAAEHALGIRTEPATLVSVAPAKPEARATAPSSDPKADPALEVYLRTTRDLVGRIRLLGYEAKHKIELGLDEIFVHVHAHVGAERPRSRAGKDAEKAGLHSEVEGFESARLDVEQALRLAERHDKVGLVLLGDPGAGKTTLLRWLFARTVDLGSGALGLPGGLCPVLLRFRRLQDADRQPFGLAPFLRRELEHEGFAEAGERLARPEVPKLFLIDGLDEVRDEATRAAVCHWLDEEVRRWNGSRFVATCRLAAWRRDARLSSHFAPGVIQALDKDQVRRLVSRWFEAVERGRVGADRSPEAVAARATPQAAKLLEDVLDSPRAQEHRLREMTRNPLLLSTLCLVHYSGDRLPEKRGELYRKCLGLLLEVWVKEREGQPTLPVEAARQVLQPLAWAMHAQATLTFAESDVRAAIAEVFARQNLGLSLDEFLRRVRDDCGLFSGHDLDRYEFLHPSFQEYLAAAHVDQGGLAEELAEHAGEPFWRETILLALSSFPSVYLPFMRALARRGALAASHDLLQRAFEAIQHGVDPAPFVEVLTGVEPARVEAGSPSAQEVGAALNLLRACASGPIREAAKVWIGHADRQVAALAREAAGEKEAERAPAGVRMLEFLVNAERRFVATLAEGPSLAHLSGHFGPGTICLDGPTGLEWCWVPAGEFWMGSSDEPWHPAFEEEISQHGRPARRVRLTRGFWMTRHGVSNQSFKRFLSETGYVEPEHWGDARFNAPDQPVVGVSWHDAHAFARWLRGHARLPPDWTVELPTEAEREYAARGPSGAGEKPRRYPWGDEEPRAELAVFGQDWTTGRPGSQGQRPAGASPFRVEDLAGNAWEWCIDHWTDDYAGRPKLDVDPCVDSVDKAAGSVRKPVDNSAALADRRVVRGGSWLVEPRILRAATRDRTHPADRDPYLGFRVVCRPVREHGVP